MKFCKRLREVMDTSDPEWAPYWIKYKTLKRIIKTELVPSHPKFDDNDRGHHGVGEQTVGEIKKRENDCNSRALRQAQQNKNTIGRRKVGEVPSEVSFFKKLHRDMKTAETFFNRTTEEYGIREEFINTGVNVLVSRKDEHAKWKTILQATFCLYKDLHLLETFAIMTYVGFSKILKKHDKMTGFTTRQAFMDKMVHKTSFVHYPGLKAMITRVENLFHEVSTRTESPVSSLPEDAHLFLEMVERWNNEGAAKAPEEPIPSASTSLGTTVVHTRKLSTTAAVLLLRGNSERDSEVRANRLNTQEERKSFPNRTTESGVFCDRREDKQQKKRLLSQSLRVNTEEEKKQKKSKCARLVC